MLFERLNKERSPFPKIYYWTALGVAPFYLILNHLLSSNFGTNGVLFALAVSGLPMSLWVAGLLVRIYLVMVRLPGPLGKKIASLSSWSSKDGGPCGSGRQHIWDTASCKPSRETTI